MINKDNYFITAPLFGLIVGFCMLQIFSNFFVANKVELDGVTNAAILVGNLLFMPIGFYKVYEFKFSEEKNEN